LCPSRLRGEKTAELRNISIKEILAGLFPIPIQDLFHYQAIFAVVVIAIPDIHRAITFSFV
jgi:hypothetical protein